MRKLFVVAVCGLVAGAAGILVAQQSFPNLPDQPVVLENDRVVAQLMEFAPGDWAGEHSHPGGQVVVIVSPIKMLYKESGEEVERSFKPGDVFWIDETTHDHKSIGKGKAVLITLK